MAGVRNDDKGCAQELSGNGPARAERNPAVLGTPDEERRGLDPLEAAVQGVEVKLAQHRSQGGAVGTVRNRSIVLIDVRGRDLLWIGVSGPEEPLSEAAAAERQHQGAEHGPAGHLEQQGFAGAESGRADEHEGADAPRVADRYLGGDRAPHRVSHQHGILNVKRVQQGGREPLVVDVAVSGGRLLRLPEAAVVERNDAEPRLHDRRQDVAPGVERGAEAVQEHDGRPRSGVDVADPGPGGGDEARAEGGAGGIASALGEGGGPACKPQGQKAGGGPPGAPPSGPRARAAIAGGGGHTPASPPGGAPPPRPWGSSIPRTGGGW